MQWVVLMAARLLIPRSLAEESRVASALTLKVIMGVAVPLYVEWTLTPQRLGSIEKFPRLSGPTTGRSYGKLKTNA